MKILLCIPTHHYNPASPQVNFLSASDFPSGFSYLASSLKEAGHEVIGANPNNLTGYENGYLMLKDVLTKALREDIGLVGLGGLCTDYAFVKDAIGIIRQKSPLTPIVLGGGIVTYDAEYIFNLLKPDFAIIGEGEETLVKLADMIDSKKMAFGEIGNLGYWDTNLKAQFSLVNHNYRPLDERPFPDYEPFGMKNLIDNYSMATRVLYRYSRPYPRPFMCVTSRACPYSCTFCTHGKDRPQYRARSLDSIMREIKESYEKYHFNILILLDELFAVDKERMVDFCNRIQGGRQQFGWDFDWCFQTHANAHLDEDALANAKKAGCFNFSYGVESASPTVLKSMNKHIKPEQIQEAVELAEKVGLDFSANLIFGDPAETEQTVWESMSFFFKYCQKACIFLSYMQPYPGGKIFDDAVDSGLIPDKKDYYEHIMDRRYNLTKMSNQSLSMVWNMNNWLETHWAWVKETPGTYQVEDYTDPVVAYSKGKMYGIRAKCPYCGGENYQRHILGEVVVKSFVGNACTHCGRRIKILLGGLI